MVEQELKVADAGEIKHLDPCALASLTCGILLCEDGFGIVHEAAEWLLGHAVWTHEFVDPGIKAALIAAVKAQYPQLAVEKPADWRALVADIRAQLGALVPVTKGSRAREQHPVETLVRLIGEREQ
ncbi:MAG: hypothetical protein ABW043_16865 [Devosia sp.]|uniref:DUF7736 domain-containing protein n=1 Tax=Devosia sp. TaxID=1871048 RepID=UPI003397D903